MNVFRITAITICSATMFVPSAAVFAIQEDAQDAPQSEAEAPSRDDEQDSTDTPSLDDLLGLEEDEQDTASETARRQQEEELQRRLAEQELSDAFKIAVEKMKLSAKLLDVQFDTGLGTQRVQEEILASLDQILEQARKMQSQQSSSSSSSSSQQQQQQSPGQQQRQQQSQSQANQRQQNPSDSSSGDPPARQDGDLNTVLEESRTEWGSLPERIRQELYQGRREKFSSIYDRLTREYYKRLAEESSP